MVVRGLIKGLEIGVVFVGAIGVEKVVMVFVEVLVVLSLVEVDSIGLLNNTVEAEDDEELEIGVVFVTTIGVEEVGVVLAEVLVGLCGAGLLILVGIDSIGMLGTIVEAGGDEETARVIAGKGGRVDGWLEFRMVGL